ncbi:MAG: hypothetical protein U5N86_05635 [Planctomycetota bacterium]|nr:hypothetical protein [Planctomycetota bacterium]
MSELRQELDEIAFSGGAKLTGVADLDAVSDRVPNVMERIGDVPVNRAFVIAMPLHRGVFKTIADRPNPLYMHHYRQVNYKLDRVAYELATAIEERGYLGVAIGASHNVKRKPMVGHISHRLLAAWAGIGWRGRSNLIVTSRYGSQVRLVSMLTDAPLEPDEPQLYCKCGECRACVEACPANAIGETFEEFDLEACYKRLCENQHISFVSHHICGVCQKVCGGERAIRKADR